MYENYFIWLTALFQQRAIISLELEVEKSDSKEGCSLMIFLCQNADTCTYIPPPPPTVRGSSESPSKEWLDEPVVDVMNPGITLGEQGFIHFL